LIEAPCNDKILDPVFFNSE